MHRLLLGVSGAGQDLLPWFGRLLGCCRALEPACPGVLMKRSAEEAVTGAAAQHPHAQLGAPMDGHQGSLALGEGERW